MKYYLGFDIGGTNIKYGLVDDSSKVLHDGKVKTPKSGTEIENIILHYCKTFKEKYILEGVGVSVPGIVKEGYLETAGAIGDFYNYNLKQSLEQKLKMEVNVENDANCALLAEAWNGHAKGHKNVVSYVVGTGIGGALLLNGQLYSGQNYKAGEFGFEILNNPYDTNARESSLTMNASIQTGLSELYYKEKGVYLDGKEIYEESLKSNEFAKELVNELEKKIAISIYNSIVFFDPGVVLIGGAISQNDNFIKNLNKNLNNLRLSHSELKFVEFPKIKANKFYNLSGVIGAVYGFISTRKEFYHE